MPRYFRRFGSVYVSLYMYLGLGGVAVYVISDNMRHLHILLLMGLSNNFSEFSSCCHICCRVNDFGACAPWRMKSTDKVSPKFGRLIYPANGEGQVCAPVNRNHSVPTCLGHISIARSLLEAYGFPIVLILTSWRLGRVGGLFPSYRPKACVGSSRGSVLSGSTIALLASQYLHASILH